MHIVGYKTPRITSKVDLVDIILAAIPKITSHSVIVVSSKIVAISEGAVVPITNTDREALIKEQADLWLDPTLNKYGYHFTIAKGSLIGSAGVDSSNGNGQYILWPRNPQFSANTLRAALTKAYGKPLGLVISDSSSMPLRRGSVGICIAHSGFKALESYIGAKDIFGNTLERSVSNRAQGIAAGATVVTGEGNEQTPLAVASDIPNLVCIDENPSIDELESVYLTPETDIFEPFWRGVGWL